MNIMIASMNAQIPLMSGPNPKSIQPMRGQQELNDSFCHIAQIKIVYSKRTEEYAQKPCSDLALTFLGVLGITFHLCPAVRAERYIVLYFLATVLTIHISSSYISDSPLPSFIFPANIIIASMNDQSHEEKSSIRERMMDMMMNS